MSEEERAVIDEFQGKGSYVINPKIKQFNNYIVTKKA
jgi:hypothetical protein